MCALRWRQRRATNPVWGALRGPSHPVPHVALITLPLNFSDNLRLPPNSSGTCHGDTLRSPAHAQTLCCPPAAANASILNTACARGPEVLLQLCPVPGSAPQQLHSEHRDPRPPCTTRSAPTRCARPSTLPGSPGPYTHVTRPGWGTMCTGRWPSAQAPRALPPHPGPRPPPQPPPQPPGACDGGGRSPVRPSLLGRKVLGPRQGKQKAKVTPRPTARRVGSAVRGPR